MISIIHIDSWSDIQLTPLADGTGWLTLKSFRCQFQVDHTDYFLVVPKGFPTDLASIPGIFRAMFKTWGFWTRGALLHDCLYYYGAGTKGMADDLFEAVLLLDQTPPEEGHEDDVTAMATAVRLGGRGNFAEPLERKVLSTKAYSNEV